MTGIAIPPGTESALLVPSGVARRSARASAHTGVARGPPLASDRGMRIEDYAIVGDTQTIALVGRTGSVDWLCFPRFDSGACFAALLGTPDHGRWLLAPRGELRRTRRRYRDATLILETEMESDE